MAEVRMAEAAAIHLMGALKVRSECWCRSEGRPVATCNVCRGVGWVPVAGDALHVATVKAMGERGFMCSTITNRDGGWYVAFGLSLHDVNPFIVQAADLTTAVVLAAAKATGWVEATK